jgi:hypothetical protein
MAFTYGLKNDSLADDAGIEPHKILGLLGAAGLVGKTYYVDSTHSRAGATQRHGTRTSPLSSLSWAITNFSAANLAKATFILLPGHSETLSSVDGADLDIDADGVNVIGVGVNSYKPTIKLGSVTTSRVNVSGDNVCITNVRFETALDNVTTQLYVTGAGCNIDGCTFINGTSMHQDYMIQLHTGADYAVIRNCEFISTFAGGIGAIRLTAAAGCDRVTIADNYFQGTWSTAVIANTTYAYTRMRILRNIMVLEHATGIALTSNKDNTGMAAYNAVWSVVAAGGGATMWNNGATTNTTMGMVENYSADADADTSGKLTPPAT